MSTTREPVTLQERDDSEEDFVRPKRKARHKPPSFLDSQESESDEIEVCDVFVIFPTRRNGLYLVDSPGWCSPEKDLFTSDNQQQSFSGCNKCNKCNKCNNSLFDPIMKNTIRNTILENKLRYGHPKEPSGLV